MSNKLKPLSVTLSPKIQKLVLDSVDPEEVPQTPQEWEKLIQELFEEYFNF